MEWLTNKIAMIWTAAATTSMGAANWFSAIPNEQVGKFGVACGAVLTLTMTWKAITVMLADKKMAKIRNEGIELDNELKRRELEKLDNEQD